MHCTCSCLYARSVHAASWQAFAYAAFVLQIIPILLAVCLKQSKWSQASNEFIRIRSSAQRPEELLFGSKRAESLIHIFESWMRCPLSSRNSEKYGDGDAEFGCYFLFGIRKNILEMDIQVCLDESATTVILVVEHCGDTEYLSTGVEQINTKKNIVLSINIIMVVTSQKKTCRFTYTRGPFGRSVQRFDSKNFQIG